MTTVTHIKQVPDSLPPDLLTTIQIAARYGVTREHVARLCKAGKLPGSIKAGRDWLVSVAAWEEYDAHLSAEGAKRGPRER